MKKSILLFLACLSPALFAEEIRMPSLAFPSTAGNGLGGPHVAYTDGIYSLFVNPAALQWSNQGSILELSTALIGPLDKFMKAGTDTFGAVGNMQDSFGGDGSDNPFSSLLDIIDGGKLPLGVDLRGPLSVGYTANGLGFGLFSRVFADVRIIGIDVDAAAYVDLMMPFGMSFNVLKLEDHELAAGFVLKPFVRATGSIDVSALDLVDDIDVMSNIAVPLMFGVGSDLGLMYRFKRDLTAGLTIGDVYTSGAKVSDINGTSPNNTYRVPLSVNLGAAYTFRLTNVWKTAPRVLQSAYAAAMIDWSRMNNIFSWNDRIHRNPILDLGFGLEFGFFNFLKLRAGLHDMLPSIGLGLEPKVFKFNIAMYGKELGNEPGINSTMAVDLSIAFRLDTKKRTWPWSKPFIK